MHATWPFNALIARAARSGISVTLADVNAVTRSGDHLTAPRDNHLALWSALVAIEGDEPAECA